MQERATHRRSYYATAVRCRFPLWEPLFIQMALQPDGHGVAGHLAKCGYRKGRYPCLDDHPISISTKSVQKFVGSGLSAYVTKKNARRYAAHITIALDYPICLEHLMCLFAPLAISFFSLRFSIAAKAIIYLRIVSDRFSVHLPHIRLLQEYTMPLDSARSRSISANQWIVAEHGPDPLFIFGFHLETTGAAIATWIAEAVVCLLFIIWLKKKLPLFGGFSSLTKLKHSITVRIVRIGLPVAMLNTLFSIINLHGTDCIGRRWIYRCHGAHSRRTDRSHCPEYGTRIQYMDQRLRSSELCSESDEPSADSDS